MPKPTSYTLIRKFNKPADDKFEVLFQDGTKKDLSRWQLNELFDYYKMRKFNHATCKYDILI